MTGVEQKELKGITIKNIVVTIVSTASIVISVMTSYFNLKGDVSDLRNDQTTQNRVNEIRLKTLETNVAVLQQEVEQIKENKPSKSSPIN